VVAKWRSATQSTADRGGLDSGGGSGVIAEPIAVIGMSCRLPQAGDPDAFWQLLGAGADAITEATEDRWPRDSVPDYRRGGFLTDVDQFDAGFFGISPNEAKMMDPQQRLSLELAWEALEDARIIATALRGTPAGVFVGAIAHDYAAMQDRLGLGGLSAYSYTGSHQAMIANRISYFFELRGPSLTLDTGQSSSLVAVQLACESLRRGDTELAMAGGVNLNLLAQTTAAIGRFGALSPQGRCHVFDERADGYVRGEGGALVVLKPLSAALRDGDQVHCVILGGAVNNDGGGDGLTAPSRQAQADVIALACDQAGIQPADVRYVELHGTGTAVGDPIEAAALGSALGTGRLDTEPLLVGSVKTNIGHLEGAAGIAGLLKVVLSIKHGQLPPSLNYQTPNPNIALDELRLRVVESAQQWPAGPVLAGVSSFGMGGTNCHLLLGSAPTDAERPAEVDLRVPWVLTAQSAPALQAQAQRLHAQMSSTPEAAQATVGLALLRTRAKFKHRAVVLGADPVTSLDALARGRPDTSLVIGSVIGGQCGFAFPGQGSQWPAMARELFDTAPAFAASISACAQALEPFVDYSLIDVLRDESSAPDFDRVDVVQPALWAVMVSLGELWRAHGVAPDLVIGHSQGEIAAATVIGALSLSDAARVVALRSRAIAAIAGSGGMLSAAVAVELIERAQAEGAEVTVAAVNGPNSVVVSGAVSALADLQRQLDAAGHRTKILPVDYASHSVAVEQIREELLAALAPIQPVSSTTLFISTLTGEPMDTAGLDADYWYRSLRQPVLFAAAIESAFEQNCGLIIECSPHPVLVTAIEETIEKAERSATVLGTLRRSDGGPDRFQRALAEGYVGGASVDWIGTAGTAPDRAAALELPRSALAGLPSYAFRRSRHWLAPPATGVERRPAPALHGRPDEPLEQALAEPASFSRRALRELVLSTTADVLGHQGGADLTATSTFKELGVESVTAVQLRNRLRAATGLRLATGLLYDYPTPDGLIARLHDLLNEVQPASANDAAAPQDDTDPVVVVAMGCRYPGDVGSPDDLWKLVRDGGDAISEFPTNRGWDTEALFATGQDRSGTSDTKCGGFVHDADQFDAAFFGINPREAAAMDPQQRLLLEICWETIERAALDHDSLRGTRTGVFVGAMAPDYGPRLHQPTGSIEGYLLTGTALSVVSGRIAYTLGLQGPALTVDTACSSSLVAIHLAAQALRRGECTLALAGGATVMSTPGMFVEFSRQSGLAVDGRCKPFAAAADGTGWSEGAGMLLLERLSDARRQGHPVLAVLRGSAVNQDGRSNGMTAPNGPSQERVIRDALADAGLVANDIDVVEAHGTGTRLGDPIEAHALQATYGRDRPADRPLWLGSVKSNLGHTQAAAGVAGVIKMIKALEHRVLPQSLHIDEPTSHVDWSSSGVRLLTEVVELVGDRPARAGVSGFGISGTNAHVILEQAPPSEAPEQPPVNTAGPLVWAMSARTSDALRAQAARLATHAESTGADDLAGTAVALSRRIRLSHRAVVIAADREELSAGLAALAAGLPHPALVSGSAAADVRPVFLFPGQGSQWVGMAVELVEASAVFAEELGRCDEALAVYTGWSVLEVLREDAGAPALEGSDVIQPVLFAVMVSLAALWRSVGVHPAAVIGHSQGEIAAACVAGALSLADAARIVSLRSKALMKLGGTGGMLALSLPAEQVQQRIATWSGRLWLAIQSGPTSTVVAGDLDALEEFALELGEAVRTRRVAIDYAAHTPHIEALREEMLSTLADVRPKHTDVVFCSSLEASFVAPAKLTADYWFRGLRNQVRFEQAVGAFAGFGTPLFIETSPHPVLTGHVQDSLRQAELPGTAIGSLRRGQGGWQRLLRSVSEAFALGADVDWPVLLGSAPDDSAHSRHVQLPTYPFERTRYWIEDSSGNAAVAASGMTASRHPLVGAVLPLADGDGFLLTGRLSLAGMPWLSDHAVDGTVLLPGTAFVELALEAAAVAGCDRVQDLTLEAPVILAEAGAVQVQLVVGGADDEGRRGLTVYTRAADAQHADAQTDAGWLRNAGGTLAVATTVPAEEFIAWPPAEGTVLELADAYDRLASRGYEYGPAFRGLSSAWLVDTDTGAGRYVEVVLPEPVRPEAGRYSLHPALLDAALHLLVLEDDGRDDTVLLPFSWRGVEVAAHGADALRVRITQLGDQDERAERVSLAIHDSTGRRIAGVEELTLRRAPKLRGDQIAQPDSATYEVSWKTLELPEADLSGQRWAVIGYDSSADQVSAALSAAGAETSLYYDLPSMAEMSPDGVPENVVVGCLPEVSADDLAYSLRENVYAVLDLVQSWVGDDRFAGRRLVILTRGAAGVGVDPVAGLADSALWGLVRSAQAEHPGRFALIDGDGEDGWQQLAATVSAGESQARISQATAQVPRLVRRTAEESARELDLAGTVLVTGGTGGLGALVARRLVESHGVRHLLLTSRRGAQAPGVTELVAELEGLGAGVTVAACDVSDRSALVRLLAGIPTDQPLKGVVHAAGVIDDATVERLSTRQLDAALAPKVDGAWHLHELTAQLSLSMFVLFSSVAGVLGNPGQGNYAAANAFLDGLAAYRQRLGLAALSLAWGLWDTDTGITGALTEAQQVRLARVGIAALSPEQGLLLFDQLLGSSAATVVAARWDNAGLRAGADAGVLPEILTGLVRGGRRSSAVAGAAISAVTATGGLAQRLASMPEAEARKVLAGLVRSHVAAALGHSSADSIELDRAFTELGFDSLTAVELRNRLDTETGLRLPATLAFNYPTVTALVEHLRVSLAPSTESPEDLLREALERIHHQLPEDDETTRTKLVAILHSTINRLGSAAGSAAAEVVEAGADLESVSAASDEEIFALIDQQS